MPKARRRRLAPNPPQKRPMPEVGTTAGDITAAPARAPKIKIKIAHQVPGRIRMKVAGAKGNPEQLEEIRQTFGLIPGIEGVDVNPDTGSIILRYDPDQHDDFHAGFHHHCNHHHGHLDGLRRPPTNEIDALASKIEQEAEFLAAHSESARAVVDFCKRADKEIKVATGNMLDLKMVLAIGVVGFTIFEVGATAATPVWVTLTLFGLNHFIEMQAEQLEAQAACADDTAKA
jgi:hypothetical protein